MKINVFLFHSKFEKSAIHSLFVSDMLSEKVTDQNEIDIFDMYNRMQPLPYSSEMISEDVEVLNESDKVIIQFPIQNDYSYDTELDIWLESISNNIETMKKTSLSLCFTLNMPIKDIDSIKYIFESKLANLKDKMEFLSPFENVSMFAVDSTGNAFTNDDKKEIDLIDWVIKKEK